VGQKLLTKVSRDLLNIDFDHSAIPWDQLCHPVRVVVALMSSSDHVIGTKFI
jgi:hypothetical protein